MFFTDEERLACLDWLQCYCEKHDVDVLAYCSMSNHIHMIVLPHTNDGLQRVLKPLHMRYAQCINRAHGWKGHLWQRRKDLVNVAWVRLEKLNFSCLVIPGMLFGSDQAKLLIYNNNRLKNGGYLGLEAAF